LLAWVFVHVASIFGELGARRRSIDGCSAVRDQPLRFKQPVNIHGKNDETARTVNQPAGFFFV
jgi:hypothetical protein